MTIHGGGNVSWQWLAGILLTIVLGGGAWVIKGHAADIETASRERVVMALRIQSLEAQFSAVREAQEREHRLLVKIAKRMGIEVAD